MLSDDDIVEAGRLRRRRLLGALCEGSQAARSIAPPALSRLVAGAGVATVLALGAALGGVVQTALGHGH